MPRDILSYFSKPSAAKGSNHSASKEPSNATKSKRRRLVSSDEDEDASQSSVKRQKKTRRADKSSVSSDSGKEDVKQPKIVSPAAMFSKPIKRLEATKVHKESKTIKQEARKEAQSHDDKDFEDVLGQLDTSDIEKKFLEEVKGKEDVPTKKKRKHSDEDTKSHKSISPKEKPKKESVSSNEDKEEAIHKTPKKKPAKPAGKKAPKGLNVEIEPKVHKTKASPKKEPDVYEERAEKKKQHAAAYQQYLQRGGARNPGSKEVPTGADSCLAGLSFLITGVLESLEREEAAELVKKYGGRTVQSLSKKTDFVIVGDEPGPSKMEKAQTLNLKLISEDDLLEMIRTRPAGKADQAKQTPGKAAKKVKQKSIEDSSPSPTKAPKFSKEKTEEKPTVKSPSKDSNQVETKKLSVKQEPVSPDRSPPKKTFAQHVDSKENLKLSPSKVAVKTEIPDTFGDAETEALVEKYRPKTMKQILGQQGDKSCARKLHYWLQNWQKNQSGKVKHAKPSPWAKNDDGAFFKAVLLSGPPGIGKTTTAQVVCNELGFDLVEFNASDTRSKRLLKEEVSDLLSNTTLKDYFSDQSSKPSSRHVLLMDEVDGMAGNEDRGGLQELIALIKSSDVPVICICNDRNNPKMRTLSNYTFDLRFTKPRIEQVRAAMKSICFKEHINISTEDLDRLINSTNQDIRQVINHLALYAGKACLQEENGKKSINKDLRLGPWDVVKKVFSAEDHKHMSIHDKSNLFFHDYSIAPLFVQENYLSVSPSAPRSELLERIAESAESLALGDMVERSIRSNNAWGLLPVQACYSSVIPGTLMSGHIVAAINFPAWLGRNSKKNKFDRLLQQITVHGRLTTGASRDAITLDYLNHIRDAIVGSLVTQGSDGIEAAVNVMNAYHLLREDLDGIIETSLWPGGRDPLQNLESKVKAAFTRAYNKSSSVPYAMTAAPKKKAATADEDFLNDEEEEGANSEDEDNVETDIMIKAKKAPAPKKTESKAKASDKAPAKRGRGRGKGK